MLAAVLLLSVFAVQVPGPYEYTLEEVAYDTGPLQVLDYAKSPAIPAGVAGPCVIHFHAGGLQGGDKDDLNINLDLAAELLGNGISIVSANYRLAPADTYPAAHEDAVRVVQFVRANAAAWEIDPELILLWGGSAGATLSTYLAFSPDHADPGSADPVEQESSRVRAVLNIKGNVYFPDYDPVGGVFEYVGANSPATWAAVPLATLLDISAAWHATQPAVFDANGLVGVYNYYNATTGVVPTSDWHDIYYCNYMQTTLDTLGNEIVRSVCVVEPNPHVPPDKVDVRQWMDLRLASRPFGNGVAGVDGQPRLTLEALDINDAQLVASHLTPSTGAFLLVGTASLGLPFLGGTLYTNLFGDDLLLVPGTADAGGEIVFNLPTGLAKPFVDELFFQMVGPNGLPGGGWALSHGLELSLP